ncbi:MAG: OadG family protein, partial [Clostridium sp.]
YDDATIASELKRVEKQKNSVMVSALSSWKNIKGDLGKMASGAGAILSEEVERVGEDSYRIKVRVSYEKKEMEFTLSAKEVTGSNYSGGMALMPTELIFAPNYTTGEKLAKAGMNTLMGMGTVFAVLIFISLIISSLKGVNTWEANFRAKKEAKENEARELAESAAPALQAAIPNAVPVVPEPSISEVCSEAEVQESAALESENLVDDRELVAVITAAIAAVQSVPVEGLVVRSIRRKPASQWKNV